MSSSWYDDDDRLVEELAVALRDRRPGPEQTGMIMVGYDIVMTDTVEAVLVHDSDSVEPAAVRSAVVGARMLSFAADGVQIEFELVDGRIVGHVDPPDGGSVALDQPTTTGPATTETAPDDLGAFEFDLRHPGTFRLRYRHPSGRTVATGWIDGPHPTRDR
jgi:hypothetical protein